MFAQLNLENHDKPIFPEYISFILNRKTFAFLYCLHLKNCFTVFKKHSLPNKHPRQSSQINSGFIATVSFIGQHILMDRILKSSYKISATEFTNAST